MADALSHRFRLGLDRTSNLRVEGAPMLEFAVEGDIWVILESAAGQILARVRP